MIVARKVKPAPATVGLAWDGTRLWAGDWEGRAIYMLDGTMLRSRATMRPVASSG